ncbi:transposase [Streptomyces lavendulae]|uniref:transposase n=1 Tax=Streptomyces lavendulae TaxID=1914 RepID=UPI0033F73E75
MLVLLFLLTARDCFLRDCPSQYQAVQRRGGTSRKGAPKIKDMGKLRYVVEQTFALLHQFKRLAIRWERRTELHDALVSLACSLICRRRLNKPEP